MRFVLDNPNQEFFCTSIVHGLEAESKELNEMIEGCRYYYFRVHGNTYFLSKDIEKKIKIGNADNNYVSSVFAIQDEINFFLETLDYNFIDFLLRNNSKKTSQLDNEIFEIHGNYLNRYGY